MKVAKRYCFMSIRASAIFSKKNILRINTYALKWLIETAQKTTDRKISDDNIGERR